MEFDTLFRRIYEISKYEPDKLAIAIKKERLSYLELVKKACNISVCLSGMGILKGDRLCLSATSKPETVAIYLAIQIIGGVPVFLDKNATMDSMSMILSSHI